MSGAIPAVPQRKNNFNLLRLLLALLVLLSHSSELIDGNRSRELLTRLFGNLSFGEFAVDGFFLLSGYLIVKSWCSDPLPARFLLNRVLRIYPGFIVAALVCAFVVGPLGAVPAVYFRQFDPSAFLASVVFLQTPAVPPVFEGQPYPNVNGAMWTISLECYCYLLVLTLGAAGLFRVRHGWLAITVLLFSALLFEKLNGGTTPYYMRLASFFLSGGCFYLYQDRIKLDWRYALAVCPLLVPCMFSWRAAELALASVGAYAMFSLAFADIPAIRGFNRLPDVSYGVYLYGWPLQKLLLWWIPALSPWLLFVAASMAGIVFGAVSWYLIEQPCLRLKGRRAGRHSCKRTRARRSEATPRRPVCRS